MNDYNCSKSPQDMEKALAGKVVKNIKHEDDRSDDILVFVFTDGAELRVRYDWIYDYSISEKELKMDDHGNAEPLAVRFTQQKVAYKHSTTQRDKLAASLKRADELREKLKKMRDRLQQVTLLGSSVIVIDELEKGTAMLFGGFDERGKPRVTKFINVGTNYE